MTSADDPCLSVVIACFNDGPMLLEAVESANANKHGRHEIIVVNDGSTDQTTLEILAQLPERGVQVIHQANGGPASARNTGIRNARGRYILPLDADNRLRPQYIDRGIEILDANPMVDVVYGDFQQFGVRTGRRRVGKFQLSRILLGNFIDTCAVFRKQAWERVGGYDEKIPVYGIEDWDFWIQLGCSGSIFQYIDEVLFDYRVKAESLTTHMLQPNTSAQVQRYLLDKPVRLTLGQFRSAVTWDYVVDSFRTAPVRTLARLIVRAYFPRLLPRKSRLL